MQAFYKNKPMFPPLSGDGSIGLFVIQYQKFRNVVSTKSTGENSYKEVPFPLRSLYHAFQPQKRQAAAHER